MKYLRALALKKHRDAEGVFVAEGRKVVDDLLGKLNCRLLVGTEDYLESHRQNCRDLLDEKSGCEIIAVSERELNQASSLQTPRDVIAVFETPESLSTDALIDIPTTQLCLALDTVQDPGNLGTIIRLADWFGIGHIFCSTTTADAYSAKTIQATMGAIARVKVHYVDLPAFLSKMPAHTPIYGTFLEGENIYTKTLSENGIIIMGNEGKGISAEVARYINSKLFIPPYPAGCETSESLNVAVATAITCAEFRRRIF